jgi:hypothetical protein
LAGPYTITLTDNTGCTATAVATIGQPAALVASSVVDSTVSCNGGADGGATASATGGTAAYTYAWSNGATTASITGVVAGTYSITVTDANGCTDSCAATITEPLALVALAVVDSNETGVGNNGGATASATGGTGSYTYSWSNSATTASITGIADGTYSVTITDANGCTDSSSVTIAAAPCTMTASLNTTEGSCSTVPDGSMMAAPAGGTSPFTYLWSSGATTGTISNILGTDTYTVTITDAGGCTATAMDEAGYECPMATDLKEWNLQDTSVWWKWEPVCGATAYTVRYKEAGVVTPWIPIITQGNQGILIFD